MFFDTHFWLTAIITGGIAAVLAFLFAASNKKWTTILSGATTLLIVRLIMYYIQPSFTGSFFGCLELILATLAPPFIFVWTIGSEDGTTRHFFRCFIPAFALLFIVPTLQYVFNAWGADNAQRFVKQAKIRVASADDKMPPTDPQHMVLVTKEIAAFRGQAALTSNGGTLSSKYKVDSDDYDLQCVQKHRYWIAPLTYTNTSDQLNFNSPQSPGYVVVDAENPETPAIVKEGFEITVFEDGDFGQNLSRFLYQSGYQDGYLLDPKFEVDDNWNPHWIVTYAKRPFGNITGMEITKVLVVDVSHATPKTTVYDIDKQPKWIDRVMPRDLLEDYVSKWGRYGGDYAKENFWSVWWGWSKTGTTEAADWDLNYTTDEQSVWVIPMTSRNSTDHGAVGVLVYETSNDSAVYYPGLHGFTCGDGVRDAMFHARDNIKGYTVASMQLYSIYGQLTWVAIYTSPQSIGASFAGVGLLHSNSVSSADVIFASDMPTALSRYFSQLASHPGNSGVSRVAKPGNEKKGKIARIAYLPGNQSTPTYVFMLDGDSSSYVVTRETYKLIPLLEKGDDVEFRYIEAPGADMAVSELTCKDLDRRKTAPTGKDGDSTHAQAIKQH